MYFPFLELHESGEIRCSAEGIDSAFPQFLYSSFT